MRVTSSLVLVLAAGCATIPSVQSSPATVAAYQSVRSGEQRDAKSGDVRFCTGPGVVVAERTKYRPSDDWTTQYRDRATVDEVRQTLRYDPALKGSTITANIDRGAVRLDGQAPSTEVVSHAIARTLNVDGVVLVEARVFTPEAPQPPVAGSAHWCGWGEYNPPA
jgi:hypothetical protein